MIMLNNLKGKGSHVGMGHMVKRGNDRRSHDGRDHMIEGSHDTG